MIASSKVIKLSVNKEITSFVELFIGKYEKNNCSNMFFNCNGLL
ncbi:hypothetical protein THALO_360008 [Tenacibaculum halocynthiae]